jgi:hypothetical protein
MYLINSNDSLAMELSELTKDCKLGCYSCNAKDSAGNSYKFPIIAEDYIDKYNSIKKSVLRILGKCAKKSISITRTESKKIRKSIDDESIEMLLHALGPYHQSNGLIKSLPYSLLLGHYWNHIFVEPILDWNYGYFITTHKSQGSDYDQVFVDGNNLMRNTKKTEKDKLIYTGLSRAKSRINVYL